MITYVLNRGSWGVRSPIDGPWGRRGGSYARASRPSAMETWREAIALGVISATENFPHQSCNNVTTPAMAF